MIQIYIDHSNDGFPAPNNIIQPITDREVISIFMQKLEFMYEINASENIIILKRKKNALR